MKPTRIHKDKSPSSFIRGGTEGSSPELISEIELAGLKKRVAKLEEILKKQGIPL